MISQRHCFIAAALLSHAVFAQNSATSSGTGRERWWDGISVVASPTISRVENISRTSDERTRRDATTYELTVSAGKNRQIAPQWLLGVSAEVNAFLEPKFDLNNRSSFGPRLSLQRKFGLGPLAPVLQFDAAYLYEATRFKSARGETAEAGLRVGKRLNSFLKLGASGHWLEHFARGATFDLIQRTVGIDATWDINEQWSVSGTASWLDGHVVTHASPTVWTNTLNGAFGPTVAAYYKTLPREVTELYGPGWLSYNAEAKADLWSLALNYRATTQLSIEGSYHSTYLVNEVGVTYPVKAWSASVVYGF